MPTPPMSSSLFRVGSALALVLVLAACTKGGQFDPTEMFNNDMFDTKKKLTGEREPLFPNGVPGTTTGVPADLVKGYQAPPEQADATAEPPAPVAKPAKPKPKPKPKLAGRRRRSSNSGSRIRSGTRSPTAAEADQRRTGFAAGRRGTTASCACTTGIAASCTQTTQPAQPVWPNPPAPGKTSQ